MSDNDTSMVDNKKIASNFVAIHSIGKVLGSFLTDTIVPNIQHCEALRME
jgi:hypothetical protein